MRRWALLPVVLLLATACQFSHVDPKATVIISGRALSATGRPLGGVAVHLYKEPDVGEVIVGSVLALGSLGAICLLPAAPAICDQGRTATTNADGTYRFAVQGSDTQGLVGDASTLDVVFTDPNSDRGASTTLRFKAQTNKVRLPATRLWDARPRVLARVAARPIFATSWSRLPPADGTSAHYSVQLLDPSNGSQLWSQEAGDTHAQIDARIIEDHAADAAVTARATVHGTDTIYLSARRPVRPIAGAPPSRNRPCAALLGRKRFATAAQRRCAATDGDLTTPARLSAGTGRTVTGLVIDLGRLRRVSLVVVRGMAGSVVVETSTNGRSYRRVGTAQGSPIAVDAPSRPAARYVRVRAADGLDESMVAEVSVW